MMKNMLWMGMGIGVGYAYSKYNKQIMKAFNKAKCMPEKKSS